MLHLSLGTLARVERVEIRRHSDGFSWTDLEEVDLEEAYWTLHLFVDRDGSAEEKQVLSVAQRSCNAIAGCRLHL